MPGLDFAVLCDYVHMDPGPGRKLHMMGAGIDAIYARSFPTRHNVGIALRLTHTPGECSRQHKLEILFQAQDGQRLLALSFDYTPTYPDAQPRGTPAGMGFGLNAGLPLPAPGRYSLEIIVDDSNLKSLDLNVVDSSAPQPKD